MAAQDNLARKLTIIPANTPEVIKLRVAAYCRVSTDSKDQLNSFAAQYAYYTSLISNQENWTLVDIYADEGITGTSAEKREDFKRLIDDCRRGLIDKVYTKSISRFARNTKDCLEVIREMKAMGIGVVFEEQHIDTSIVSGEMLTAVFAACAQAESESISKNMRWSYQKRMESGRFITCRAPFGYELLDGKLVIEENEALVVRKIFDMFLSGWNTIEISKEISKLGIKASEGSMQWKPTSIIYILQNEKYIGDSLVQKTFSTETIPYEKKLNKGERQQLYISNTHPAIIDRKTFEMVQLLYKSKRPQITGKSKNKYCFTGLLYCGYCGTVCRRTISSNTAYWVCNCHNRGGSCLARPIRETQIYSAFLRLYYKLKHNGLEILTAMVEDLEVVRERMMLWSPDIIEINKRISSVTSQSHKLSLLNQQGAVDSDIFISKSNQLAEQLQSAKREKERLLQKQDDDVLRKTREIIDALQCGPDFLESFDAELFHELIEKIIVESNERIRFRLVNGLELPEYIERTVR